MLARRALKRWFDKNDRYSRMVELVRDILQTDDNEQLDERRIEASGGHVVTKHFLRDYDRVADLQPDPSANSVRAPIAQIRLYMRRNRWPPSDERGSNTALLEGFWAATSASRCSPRIRRSCRSSR